MLTQVSMTGKEMAGQIWVVPELNTEGGEPSKTALGLLSEARRAAARTGGEVIAAVFAAGPAPVPDVLAQYGVARALVFQDPIFRTGGAEACAAALLPRLRPDRPRLVIMGDTASGRELAPRLAVQLEATVITNCTKIEFSVPEFYKIYRPVYGGQLDEEITCPAENTVILTLALKALNVLPPAPPAPLKSLVITSRLPEDIIKLKHLAYLPADYRTVDVSEAATIVGAGMGAATDELYPLVTELAALVEGSIGTTRPVADGGRVGRERLIGQTGKTVSPGFYLALGISGATHHTGGIQEAGKIVAVNRDPQAPIFRSADAGAAADLRAVLPELIKRIRKAKADGEIL